jgi:hypothetical protein
MVGLGEIERSIPHLVLAVHAAGGRPVSSATVQLDGSLQVDALDGTLVEVDPGAHHLRVTAEGFATFDETVVVDEGDPARRVEVVLRPVEAAPAPANATSSVPASPPPSTRGRQLALAGALGGTGVAFLVAGATLGLVAKSKYDRAIGSECQSRDPHQCSSQGASDGATAHVDAAASTVAFIAGAALAAASTYVVLTLPGGARAAVSATADARAAGLTVAGQW